MIYIKVPRLKRIVARPRDVDDELEPDYRDRWSRLEAHKKFVNGIMEFIVYWFQMLCFFYIALHVILMAKDGDIDKATTWALIALIIKPWGKEIHA